MKDDLNILRQDNIASRQYLDKKLPDTGEASSTQVGTKKRDAREARPGARLQGARRQAELLADGGLVVAPGDVAQQGRQPRPRARLPCTGQAAGSCAVRDAPYRMHMPARSTMRPQTGGPGLTRAVSNLSGMTRPKPYFQQSKKSNTFRDLQDRDNF